LVIFVFISAFWLLPVISHQHIMENLTRSWQVKNMHKWRQLRWFYSPGHAH